MAVTTAKRPTTKQRKFQLDEKDLPTHWYNIQADLPSPLPPPLHPGTGQPIGPADLAPLFPMELIKQEVSRERWIEIPEPVRDAYKLWRPTPLIRALGLEKVLGGPARIYYKWEGVSPAGSHKPNTAVAQAYYNKQEGTKRLATETGAGQWGSALALTNAGRAALAKDPKSPGSLGLAISEAVEDAATRDDTKYSLGSVLNHVLMHQTVIGQETKKQLELAGDRPDILVGCIGGGSNFSGFAFPFVADKLTGKVKDLRVIAVEPMAAPSITKGRYVYDFGDEAMMTPLVKMHTLGHSFMPAPIHAGGLRYHGMAPAVSALYEQKLIEAVAVHQRPTFEAAVMFARAEGYLPAPESAHAIRVVIDEALRCKESGEAKTIAFNLSGHGHFDLGAYERYMNGELEDYEYPAEKVREALADLPKVAV